MDGGGQWEVMGECERPWVDARRNRPWVAVRGNGKGRLRALQSTL